MGDSEKRYLYYSDFKGNINRVEIERESPKYWFAWNGNRIHKEKMRTGEGWNVTHYKTETPELKEKYFNYVILNRLNIITDELLKNPRLSSDYTGLKKNKKVFLDFIKEYDRLKKEVSQ